MDTNYIVDTITKGAYIAIWFIGAVGISFTITQIPFVRNWFEKIGE